MADVKFFKVTTLPATPVANAIYYVQNGSYIDQYVTDSAGVAKKVGNTLMIQELTQNINAGFFT
jgi:hypothetical protein